MPFDYLLKVIVVGESGVGKSCLVNRIAEGTFKEGQAALTIGVEFGNFICKITDVDESCCVGELEVKDKIVNMQIWDTAGQESYRSLTRVFFRKAQAAILTYDITSEASFSDLELWLKDIKNNSK